MNTITAQLLIDTFHDHVNRFVSGEVFHQGTVVGVLKKACGNKDETYRKVLMVLTGRDSSKLLNPAQWNALYRFVMPVKPEGGKWGSGHGDDKLKEWCELLVLYTEAQEIFG